MCNNNKILGTPCSFFLFFFSQEALMWTQLKKKNKLANTQKSRVWSSWSLHTPQSPKRACRAAAEVQAKALLPAVGAGSVPRTNRRGKSPLRTRPTHGLRPQTDPARAPLGASPRQTLPTSLPPSGECHSLQGVASPQPGWDTSSGHTSLPAHLFERL